MITIIYRSSFEIIPNDVNTFVFTSFEHCCFKILTNDSKPCFFSCIYKPTKSKKNVSTVSDFILEFNEYLELLSNEQRVFIFGDFNFHFEKTNDNSVNCFKRLLTEHDFSQSINVSTHKDGHTLDLLLSRTPETASITPTVSDLCLSDHFVVITALPFPKPKRVVCNVSCRNFKAIEMNSFKAALNDSISSILDGISSFSFFECIRNVLDKFAPLKEKQISVRLVAPWMNLV